MEETREWSSKLRLKRFEQQIKFFILRRYENICRLFWDQIFNAFLQWKSVSCTDEPARQRQMYNVPQTKHFVWALWFKEKISSLIKRIETPFTFLTTCPWLRARAHSYRLQQKLDLTGTCGQYSPGMTGLRLLNDNVCPHKRSAVNAAISALRWF